MTVTTCRIARVSSVALLIFGVFALCGTGCLPDDPGETDRSGEVDDSNGSGEVFNPDEAPPEVNDEATMYRDFIVPPDDDGDPSMESQVGSAQVIYVNFDGVTITECADDSYCSSAEHNESTIISRFFDRSSIDFSPYGDQQGRQVVLDELERAFADYDVYFTTHRPQTTPYTMLVVSDWSGHDGLGVAPLNCDNTSRNDIAFVYGAASHSPQIVAIAAVHELGHAFGLSHVEPDDDYMHWIATHSASQFTVAPWDEANSSDFKCMDGNTQHAPSMLEDALGQRGEADCDVDRLAGSNRHETAVEISRHLYPTGADTAVLTADADTNPDALAAGPLAARFDAPLLLTQQSSLPDTTADELQRLGVDHVVITGGEAVVSEQVEQQLAAVGISSVDRQAGSTRYDTAAEIARQVGAPDRTAFIASAHDDHLVDALAAGGVAAALGAPILLVPNDGSIPPATADALDELNIENTIVVGGAAAIPDQTLTHLPSPQRLAGANRFETALEVAEFALDRGISSDDVFVARADTLPDALASGAGGRILVLSPNDSIYSGTFDFLDVHAHRATLLGGEAALGGDVERAVCVAVQ